MKNFLNILSICAIFLSFGAIKAIGNDLDEVICNAMKGMQAQEEKKIPYKIGKYELIGLTVDCKNKALTTEKKHIEYLFSEFAEDYKNNPDNKEANQNVDDIVTKFIARNC